MRMQRTLGQLQLLPWHSIFLRPSPKVFVACAPPLHMRHEMHNLIAALQPSEWVSEWESYRDKVTLCNELSVVRRGEAQKRTDNLTWCTHTMTLRPLFLFLFQTLHAHTLWCVQTTSQHQHRAWQSAGRQRRGKSGYTRFNGGACLATSVSLEKRFMGQTLLLCWDNRLRTLSPTPFPNRRAVASLCFCFHPEHPARGPDTRRPVPSRRPEKNMLLGYYLGGFTSTWKGHFWILHASPFLPSPDLGVCVVLGKLFSHNLTACWRFRALACHKFVASSSNACFETWNIEQRIYGT